MSCLVVLLSLWNIEVKIIALVEVICYFWFLPRRSYELHMLKVQIDCPPGEEGERF